MTMRNMRLISHKEFRFKQDLNEPWDHGTMLHLFGALSVPDLYIRREAAAALIMLCTKRLDLWRPFWEELQFHDSTMEWRRELQYLVEHALFREEAADQIQKSEFPFEKIPEMLGSPEVKVIALVSLVIQFVLIEVPEDRLSGLEEFEACHFKVTEDRYFIACRAEMDVDEKFYSVTGELLKILERIRYWSERELEKRHGIEREACTVRDENSYEVLLVRIMDPNYAKPEKLSVNSLCKILTMDDKKPDQGSRRLMRDVLLPKLIGEGVLVERANHGKRTYYSLNDMTQEGRGLTEMTQKRCVLECENFDEIRKDPELAQKAVLIQRETPLVCRTEMDYYQLLKNDIEFHTIAFANDDEKLQDMRHMIYQFYLQRPTFVKRYRPAEIALEHAMIIEAAMRGVIKKCNKTLEYHLRDQLPKLTSRELVNQYLGEIPQLSK